MSLILENMPLFLIGLRATLILAVVTLAASTVIGVTFGVMATLPSRAVRILVALYVETLRDIPLIVTIFAIFFGAPFAGFPLEPLPAAAGDADGPKLLIGLARAPASAIVALAESSAGVYAGSSEGHALSRADAGPLRNEVSTDEIVPVPKMTFHDERLGSYALPPGSVVVGAGNRQQDNALARPMASALVNRMWHVHLAVSAADWLAWAQDAGIHPLVVDYVRNRPDHLWSAPPKTEEVFSTPRAWHLVSDVLHSYGDPTGTGAGGPGYLFELETRPNHTFDAAGVVGMARTKQPNTNGSQFFITFQARPDLDPNPPTSLGYTVFAKLTEGLNVLPKIKRGEPPATPTVMTRVYIIEK